MHVVVHAFAYLVGGLARLNPQDEPHRARVRGIHINESGAGITPELQVLYDLRLVFRRILRLGRQAYRTWAAVTLDIECVLGAAGCTYVQPIGDVSGEEDRRHLS